MVNDYARNHKLKIGNVVLAYSLTIVTTNFMAGLKTLDYLVNLPKGVKEPILKSEMQWNEEFPFPVDSAVRVVFQRGGEKAAYFMYEHYYKYVDFKR